MMSAPSSTSRRACATAAVGSRKRPPSENESGVILRTPITSGRPLARSPVSALPVGAAPETDGAPCVTFAAVVLAAMVLAAMVSPPWPPSLSLFGALMPLMALALRGHPREVKRRQKLNLGVSQRQPPAAIN